MRLKGLESGLSFYTVPSSSQAHGEYKSMVFMPPLIPGMSAVQQRYADLYSPHLFPRKEKFILSYNDAQRFSPTSPAYFPCIVLVEGQPQIFVLLPGQAMWLKQQIQGTCNVT